MSVYFATPNFQRAGVVAGFTLGAPDWAGTPEGAGTPISFAFQVNNITVLGVTIQIATGYEHWVNIGGQVYSYTQQNGDTVAMVASWLANAINSSDNNLATATSTGGTLTLAPRQNTGAEIWCTASDGATGQNLCELTGNELVPSITVGVLFAQGTMYRPAVAPILPAAPASRLSYLYYNSGTGWYWSASATPTTSGDACVGWVATNATGVIAVSSSKIGTGPEESLLPGGPAAIAVGSTGVDTGVPGTPSFETAETSSQLLIGDLALSTAVNAEGVDFATFILYYVNEAAGSGLTLSAALGSGALNLSASGALPYSTPGQVTFTFSASTVGSVTIGPGYVHSIGIGARNYVYEQQTEDTAATIAQALANVINASADPNAYATAVGATVVLTALQSTGATVTCSASDANTPQTLTEAMASYVVVDEEIIAVGASNGSVIARGQKGSTAAAHAAGATIWPVTDMTVVFALPEETYGTPDWPTVIGQIPWAGKSLVAADCWVSNEIGPSPVATECFTGVGPFAVDALGNPLAPDVAAFTATVTANIQIAGQPYYQFSGTVETGLAPAGTAEIDVRVTPAGGTPITIAKIAGPFAASTVYDWASMYYPEPTSGPSLVFQPAVVPMNADLAPTVSAHTVGTLTVGNGTSSGSGSPLPAEQPHSVTLTEASGARTISPVDRTTHTTLLATVLEAITPPSGQTLGTFIHLQLSSDGVTWGDLGTYPSDRTDEDGTHTYYATSISIPNVLVYNAAQNWYVRAWSATVFYEPGPLAAVESAAYSLAGLGLPLATDITALTVTPGTGGAYPYNMERADGTTYYSIPQISYNDTGAVADVNAFFGRITAQDLDANHNAIGPEQPFAGAVVSASGQVQTFGPLMGNYGTAGGGYTRTGNLTYVRLKLYVISRLDQTSNAFQNGAAATLETGVGSGAGYVDVLVAVNGASPPLDIGVTSGLSVNQAASTVRIACGAATPYVDSYGNTWAADVDYSGGAVANTSHAITGTPDQALYQSQRYGAFTYTIPVSAGRYGVTLKFCEDAFGAAGARVFSVSINLTTVLSEFDIFAAAGAQYAALDKVFSVSVPIGSNSIVIAFVTGSANYPKVDAIQVAPRSSVGVSSGSGIALDSSGNVAVNYGANLGDDGTGKATALNSVGSNLLSNPGFEQGTVGWSVYSFSGGPTFVTTTAQNHTINGARSLTFASTPTVGGAGAYQLFEVTPGDALTLSCWAKGDAGNNIQLFLSISFQDSTGAQIPPQYNVITQNVLPTTWTQYSGLATAPAGAASAILQIQAQYLGAGTGNVYFDDASAVRLNAGSGVSPTVAGGYQLNYGSGTQDDGTGKVTLKLGGGVTFSGTSLQVNLAGGLQLSGGQVALNLGSGVTLVGSAVTLNAGNGLQLVGGQVAVSLGNGLTLAGSVVVVNASNGLTTGYGSVGVNYGAGLSIVSLQLAIPTNGVADSMILGMGVQKLNVSSALTLSGGASLTVTNAVSGKSVIIGGNPAIVSAQADISTSTKFACNGSNGVSTTFSVAGAPGAPYGSYQITVTGGIITAVQGTS